MKNILSILLVLVLFSSIHIGQVPRTVLMEYATNASCPPCAAYNPTSYTYLKSNYGQMVSIWYHAWWPGPNDPMYLANVAENRNRIEYYNIDAVPRFVIDGVLSDYADNQSALVSHTDTRMQMNSPVKLSVASEIVGDSIDIEVTLVVVDTVNESNLKLRTAIIEQMMIYDSPPGSNGEKEFPHVFKKFINGTGGINIANLNVGDSIVYTIKHEILPDWNLGKIAVVSFLQSDDTKEVLQACSNLKFHEISSSAPNFELIQKNKTYNYEYSITNEQEDTLKLRISLDELSNKETWENDLLYDNTKQKSFDVEIAVGESISFQLEIITDENLGYINIKISAENIGGESSFTSSLEYFGLTNAGDILLIDDDGGADYDKIFNRVLNNLGKEYTKIDHEILDDVKKMIDFSVEYKVILWNMGDHAPSLEGSDLNLLLDYLNAGGRAFFSGSDFAHDIHDVQRSSTGKFFFRNYLDASYLTDSVTTTTLRTVAGNPLFENDLTIQVNPLYSTLPDGVASVKAPDHMIMKYEGTDYYGMVSREFNEYKTAYLTCGLEQIDTEANQDLIIEKVLDWFAKPVVGVEETKVDVIPNEFNLEQNYPNPFNPSTTINFALPVSSHIVLSVYNSLGEKVSELVNKDLSAGYHTINFKADNFSSGIYFYKIKTSGFVSVKKMLLLK